MKKDHNFNQKNAEARKVYKQILDGKTHIEKNPAPEDLTEKCNKCGKGKVQFDMSNEPEWKFTLVKSTVINVGGHTLLFICGECGSHITRRGISYCKSKYPEYKK